jgi:hypothetical protein
MFNHQEEAKNMNLKQETPHDHESLFDQAWEKTQDNFFIKGLNSGQKIEDLLPQVAGFKESFERPLTRLDCSDGRVCPGTGKMGLPGIDVLLSEDQRQVLINEIKDQGLTISGHESCGAAAIAHPGADSDDFGYQHAEKLAQVSGNKYEKIDHSRFKSSIHNERLLVIEGTKKWDCANWEGFPPQFINSAPALKLSNETAKEGNKALTGIALGSHGFSEKRFDSKNPFYIIISAEDQRQLEELTVLAQEGITEMSEKDGKDYSQIIKIDGFIAPTE